MLFGMSKIAEVRRKFLLLSGHLNEFTERAWAATEALALGHGGIVVVAEATGMSRRTIERGIRQLAEDNSPPPGRSRHPGGGRKSADEKQPGLLAAMEALIEPLTRGDPDSPFPISVMHFPPGTSKWNKVEHRLFSFISQNWRGEPLADDETVVSLIRRTTTRTGLQVKCRLDMKKYPTGRKVTDEEMAMIHLVRDTFHGDWNYAIHPNEQN